MLRGRGEGIFYCGKQNPVCRQQAEELLPAECTAASIDWYLRGLSLMSGRAAIGYSCALLHPQWSVHCRRGLLAG